MSNKISRTLEKHFKNIVEHFWDQKWAPARAARTARTPRPIFDDKKCSKNVLKMFFNVQDICLTFVWALSIGISIKKLIKNPI